MSDKEDSWWKDDNTSSGSDTTNPFEPRDTQNDASNFKPRSITDGWDVRMQLNEKQSNNK
ncbi:hypothetical protein [Lysinibacillus sp. NPDC059133]|uniref:hypothetical protein n=1 Tax=Lysinibacillus sp. NPDC059133 TaxID=3346737 RepID=UPI003694CB76